MSTIRITFIEARSLVLRADIITLDDIQIDAFFSSTNELILAWEKNGDKERIFIPNDATNEVVEKNGNLLTFHDDEGEFVSVKLFTLTPLL